MIIFSDQKQEVYVRRSGRTIRLRELLAVILALAVLFGMISFPAARVNAAAKKPTIPKKITIQVKQKKTIKIRKNGYKIKKILSAKSSKKSVAKVTVKGKKVIIRGKKAGKTRIKIKIRAKKKGRTKIFRFTTVVKVKKAKPAKKQDAARQDTTKQDTGSKKDSGQTGNTQTDPKQDTETGDDGGSATKSRVDRILEQMSLDEKISQMLMPSFRTWNDTKVTVLSEASGVADALKRHAYGGVILFGQNIIDSAQTARLVSDLQKNNAETGNVPYFIAADQEGGSVNRLTMGTRGTGSMAIGATGEKAETNAKSIGAVFGEEMQALGINVNLGPCVDVIKDLEDPGLSTRVFSDDAATNAKLSLAFAEGVGKSQVITTYKHFPGAGDGSDYPTSIKMTLKELKENGLEAYRRVIGGGAEMVMTSATTFPEFDDPQVLIDGETRGYYPATMSSKIVNGLLREELGFDGVVITDALEMDQFIEEPDTGKKFFSEDAHTAAHDLKVAEKCIAAGCDILLLPMDLSNGNAVQYYDDYIEGIAGLVKDQMISEERIDESVKRILSLKEKHGILDLDVSGTGIEDKAAAAAEVVGSAAHHAVEIETAKQAVTLVKNTETLPLAGEYSRIAFVGNSINDSVPITYAIEQLKEEGKLDENVRVENHISGESSGDETSDTCVTIDYFYRASGALVYSDELANDVNQADAVICLSKVGAGIDQLQDNKWMMQGVGRTLQEAHGANAKFVLLSTNLPVDTKRFPDADAIVCAYLSAGYGVDPTARMAGSENVGAFNANVPAAICAMFDDTSKITGKIPIHIPELRQQDGSWNYVTE